MYIWFDMVNLLYLLTFGYRKIPLDYTVYMKSIAIKIHCLKGCENRLLMKNMLVSYFR